MKFIREMIAKKREPHGDDTTSDVAPLEDALAPLKQSMKEDLDIAKADMAAKAASDTPVFSKAKQDEKAGEIDTIADVQAKIERKEEAKAKADAPSSDETDIVIDEAKLDAIAKASDAPKAKEVPAVSEKAPAEEKAPQAVETKAKDDVVAEKPDAPTAQEEAPAVNIWDIEDDGSADLPIVTAAAMKNMDKPVAVDVPTPAPATPSPKPERRPGRTKTRILGFEHSDGVVDLFDPKATVAQSGRAKFPVGWIVIVDGPGRGESFSLTAGMSQIGRGDDQAVQLNFGDTSISRTNHAAIAYDPENHKFLLGHGGKSNIVRLNDKPVLSTEDLNDADIIRIGETTLRFVALCNDKFNWANTDGEENEDVAIA